MELLNPAIKVYGDIGYEEFLIYGGNLKGKKRVVGSKHSVMISATTFCIW